MKRWIATFVIIAIIATGIVLEQVYMHNTFKVLKSKLDALIVAVEACGDDSVDTAENIDMIADLEKYWRTRERTLCYLVKHTETFQISDTILYAQNFIKFGNKEETMLALNKLEYLFDVHHYNMGSSIENII